MSTSSIKRQIRRFHVVVVRWTSKKGGLKQIFVLVEFKRTEFFTSYGDCLLTPNFKFLVLDFQLLV